MTRTSKCEDISDEKFEKIIIPFDKEIDKYLYSIIYDYIAFYLAKDYELSALCECL